MDKIEKRTAEAMTPTERQRIENDADKATLENFNTSDRQTNPYYKGYVAGAIAEHDKVRNQAIQDCIDSIKQRCTDWEIITKPLEKLKQ